MAFPNIGHYTQRPTSWKGVGPVGGRPGWRPSWLRSRVMIAGASFGLPSGTRVGNLDEPMGFVPLGFTQDLVVYSYYTLPDGAVPGPGTLDDDNWWTETQIGTSSDAITLRDGTVWEDVYGLNGVSWNDLSVAHSEVSVGEQQSTTVTGQPTDGTGIQKWSLGASSVEDLRPTVMGGIGVYHWLRVKLHVPTAGVSLDHPHSFVVLYFANKYMWQRKENPFFTSNRLTHRMLGGILPAMVEQSEFSLVSTDIGQRPSQVKV